MLPTSGQRVTALKLRFKADIESHAVTAFAVEVPTGGRYTFRTGRTMSSTPERMRVQVVGVTLADGTVWGAMDVAIDAHDEVVQPPGR